jgi:hypothetical protein
MQMVIFFAHVMLLITGNTVYNYEGSDYRWSRENLASKFHC